MLRIWDKYKVVIIAVVSFIVLISAVKACENSPKEVTKSVTKIVTKYDTITKVLIKEVPKIVYVNRYVDIKGEKVIVYVDKPTDSSTLKANQYDTTLKSNDATASLKITTTGELLDVSGVIEYPKETTTIEKIKYRDKSGLFAYAQVPLNKNQINVEAGLIYQFKNSIMLLGGVQYNQFTKSADLSLGIGFKIF